jgi:ubiquinone/menaquinone biosynthesis C-methylase UbiE
MLKKINQKVTGYINAKFPNWDVTIALRYLPIIKNIRDNYPSGTRVLDVGSGEFGLATYIKKGFDITATDIDFGKQRQKGLRIVKASAESLPFSSEEFEVVVSVDMLEHLPGKIRKKAINEMVRVAKSKVFISCPRGGLSEKIDRLISKYYKLTHKKELEYLNEHLHYGLPSEKILDTYIKEALEANNKKAKIEKKGNTNCLLWLILLLLGFSEVNILTSFYHKLLLILPILGLMHFWPTYRVIYAVSIKGNGQ